MKPGAAPTPLRLASRHGLWKRIKPVASAPAWLRMVVANFGWLMADRLFRIGISVLVGAWVARHLGPSQYGELAYVLALLALFQTACTLGLDGPIVRDISRDPASCGTTLGSGLWLRIGAGLFGWLAAVSSVAVIRPGDGTSLLMVAIAGASLVFQPAELVDLWLQSQNKNRLAVPFRLVAYVSTAAFRVALILVDAPLWAFAAAALLDAVLVAIALRLTYRRLPTSVRWRWEGSAARELMTQSWPLLVSAVSVGIYMRIDQIVLRELASEHELGLYSAVLPFSQAWHMIPMMLYASILPKLTELHRADPVGYQVRLQQAYSAFTWGGLVVAGVTAACAPWLVLGLLGEKYADAIPVLRWHVITNVFVFMGIAQTTSIVIENTPRLAMSKTLIGVAASLIANVLLVPRWGAVGAAWSAMFSYFCSVMMSNAFLAPGALRMQMRALLLRHEKRS